MGDILLKNLNVGGRRSEFLDGRAQPMKARFMVLLGALIVSLSALGLTALLLNADSSASAQPLPVPNRSKIDPALQDALQDVNEGEMLRVIVYMQGTAADQFFGLPQEKTDRRQAVVERLQQTSVQSQEQIEREIVRLTAEDQIESHRTLWIINGIQVTATPEAITHLSNRTDVARIAPDAQIRLVSPLTPTISALTSDQPWGLKRTRVQHVWAGLGITGTGVTVAIMDTGTDWLHPALVESYRGHSDSAPPEHEANWFDAVEGSPEPIDPHGHGTHVTGTASGSNGIGAAPGSKWIAVRILGANGFGYLGDIHAGFQWLLAPDGDPALAPDIVNGSWSASPALDEFMPDVSALHAASIITVFAAGNNGPEEGSVRSPANYPNVVAVGASDDIDAVAWFSSRGPSTWTTQAKPTILAPGTGVLSSLPGGQYGFLSGTSMAAPHVAGMQALLLSADHQLNFMQATMALTRTAVQFESNLPNNVSGWGRADAYAAASLIMNAGLLSGDVQSAGLPLPSAAITITTPGGVDLAFSPANDGSYSAELISGTYELTVTSYGYQTYKATDILVADGSETVLDVELERLPFGTVSGRLVELDTGRPLSGSLRITGPPINVSVGSNGLYEIELPAGSHELVAWVNGYRLGRYWVEVVPGAQVTHDFQLHPWRTILLVDSGQWYSGSQSEYYSVALEDNDFAYTKLAVRDPFQDVPTTELLSNYDVIVWSAPSDSPGAIGAADTLARYLDGGGKLFISGQDVAAIDSGFLFSEYWWSNQLRGLYRGKESAPFDLTGEPDTAFEQINITLADHDSYGNSVEPDASNPMPRTLTEVGIRYGSGNAASLLAGQCEPFRLAYFGFGLEHVIGSQARANLLAAAFDFLDQPEIEVGARYGRSTIDDLVPPGGLRSYQVEVSNLSETLTDTYNLEVVDTTWSTTIVTETLEIGPCEAASTEIEIQIPADLQPNSIEEFRLLATSTNDPSYRASMEFHLKIPGHILLVDDDRWYDQEPIFKQAMDSAGFVYDFWENNDNDPSSSSPQADLLSAYDYVIWYTGYDWLRPITNQESNALHSYVQQGGRLFLTSQDYLYYHASDRLTRDYLGVMQYVESVTPTIAYGGTPLSPFSDLPGPMYLQYGPYQNNGDGTVPAPGTIVSLWHDQGYAAGLASAGTDWRTVFWALPFETLPEPTQAKAMNRIVGWLSDLGESIFVVDRRTGLPGDTRIFTITLQYAASGPGSNVSMTNTVPLSLTIDESTVTGASDYDPQQNLLTWQGHLEPGQQHQIRYEASLNDNLSPGTRMENHLEYHYEDHDLTLERSAPVWAGAADVSTSLLQVTPSVVGLGQPVTYELTLHNRGPVGGQITSSLRLLKALTVVTGTVKASQGEVTLSGQVLIWQGWLWPGETVTTAVTLTSPVTHLTTWLPATAIVEDHTAEPIVIDTLLEVRPPMTYLPLFIEGKP